MQGSWVVRPRQLMSCSSCLTNLISYGKEIHLVDEGKASAVACLDFSKASDAVSCSIFLEKLAALALGGETLCCVKKKKGWMGGRDQGVMQY